MVNGADDVFVERMGRIEGVLDRLFEGEEAVLHLMGGCGGAPGCCARPDPSANCVVSERLGMYLDIQFATPAPGASLIMFGAWVGAISTSLAAGAMHATVVRLIGAGQT